MATRLGIELSPAACRIVELDGPVVVPGRSSATRVRSHAILPPSGPETEQRFASIGRRPVTVVVWGARSDHRQVVVSNGSYEKMRAEALASARAAGVDPRGRLADIAPALTTIKGADRQPVVLALANADAVSEAIRPLVEAGVRIRSIITPADALLGLARSRSAFAPRGPGGPVGPVGPGDIEAYVALDATATCVALVRDGSLLGARELPWGYETPAALPGGPQDAETSGRRADLAARLADELADFLMMVGARHEHDAVTQVAICGGLAELRTMTLSLMERLDVEVEALDSLYGIDVERLPEPEDEFRERAAELRLAWSAAADWRGPINLLRYRRRRDRRVALAKAAVVAGIAAGLGTGWAIEQSQWWQSKAPEPIVRATPPSAPPTSAPARANAAPRTETPAFAAPQPLSAPPAVPSVSQPVSRQSPTGSAVTAGKPPQATILPAGSVATPASPGSGTTASRPTTATVVPKPPVTSAAAATPPSATRASVPAPPAPVPSAMLAPAVAPAKPTPIVPEPRASVPAPTAARVTSPVAAPAVAPSKPTPIVRARPILAAPASPGSKAPATAATPVTPARRPPAEPPSLPFAAVLGTILYSPDRKLAIVNDRIVGPGDEVNGATIVDITPTTVLLRDAQGRLRSLTLGVGARTPTPLEGATRW